MLEGTVYMFVKVL